MTELLDFSIISSHLDKHDFGEQSRRLFHGRGQCYPGFEHVCIDWFAPALVVTLFNDAGNIWEREFIAFIKSKLCSERSLYLQKRYEPRPSYEHLAGPALSSLFAHRDGLKFVLQLSNQNIGYFLDAEPARHWLERVCEGKRVLNLFSYTCSFSLVATAAGARSVLNMDLSSKSLNVGRESYRASELDLENVKFFANDILKSWSRLKRYGPYDLVVIDPPSFQKGSFIESKDYEKVLRRIEQFTVSGSEVLCCLNSPGVGVEDFKQRLGAELKQFTFSQLLEPSQDFPNSDVNAALKMLIYKRV